MTVIAFTKRALLPLAGIALLAGLTTSASGPVMAAVAPRPARHLANAAASASMRALNAGGSAVSGAHLLLSAWPSSGENGSARPPVSEKGALIGVNKTVLARSAAPGGIVNASEQANSTEQLYHTFSRKHPHFKKTDKLSKFTAQVTFSSGLPMAWGFTLSPALQAVATSEMDCNAHVVGRKGYHDHHKIPANATLHSTVPKNTYNRKYVLEGSCKFKVDVGGQSGTATVSWKFHWEIVR